MEAFADVVRAGKALYIGVSEWTPKQLRAGHALAREKNLVRLQPAEVQRALPGYRAGGRANLPGVVDRPDLLSPIEQGILTGKYKPGQQSHQTLAPQIHRGPVDRRDADPCPKGSHLWPKPRA
jgi:aryl-alcohol dehydrogenase-like predicted oxidoreductase